MTRIEKVTAVDFVSALASADFGGSLHKAAREESIDARV
jgi:hypothetical protein